MPDQFLAVAASLIAGIGLGFLGRALLRSRVRLSWSEAVVGGLVGAAGGTLFAGFAGTPHPVLAAGVALAVTVLALLAMERWQARRRLPRSTTRQLMAAGESGSVEFKSSARYNRHSGRRDERVEHAIVRALAGFLNAEGGILLIGVSDDGGVTGIEDDYPLLKAPGRDPFELWLRDLLIKSMGPLATATLHVEFTVVDGHDVCRVSAPPATRPVFVRSAKGQPAALYVRVGNSTRELGIDEALTYCVDRWGRRALKRLTA
ncbi:AlbA family DNA-binding domain-containing protein [Nocardioides guangzhouensis]|nr:ATP-binding protein [Nocardioides guangzhouensis]